MAEQDKLRDMLDNLINDKGEQAQVDFHEYLQGKMQDTVQGTHNEQAPIKKDEE